MDTKNLIRKSKSHSPDARGRLLDTPLLGRKSVLMGMLTSGLVIAGAARPSTASAGTLKPAPLVATQPTTVPRWASATPYALGQQVISPNCDVVAAKVSHTSSSAFAPDTAKWTLSCSDARRDAVGMFAKDNGIVGNGVADDGAALNTLLSTAAALGVPVVLTPLSVVFTTVGIVVPSNTRLNGNGATIKSGISSGTYTPTIALTSVSNVIIQNLKVDGNKAAFASSEFKHGLSMRTCTDILLQNCTFTANNGDGIAIAGDNVSTWSERITLENVSCTYNNRNGLSVMACKTLRVLHGSYSFSQGTLPQAGIDIEPNNPTDWIQDLVFTDVLMTNNASTGFEVNLVTAPTVRQEGIRLTNCSMRNSPSGTGADLITASHVTFTDCEFNDNYIGLEADTKVNHLTVRGGVVLRNSYRGIFGVAPTMNDWLISGVKILDNTAYGVLLNGTGHFFVLDSNTIGNDTTTATKYGISTQSSSLTDVSVVNNYARGLTGGLSLGDDASTRINTGNKT
jgi:hypothetical protein